MGKHRFDDLEARNVNGRVHVQEDSGVAEELLDAEVEHHAIAAVEFHGMLANLEDFLGGEYLPCCKAGRRPPHRRRPHALPPTGGRARR